MSHPLNTYKTGCFTKFSNRPVPMIDTIVDVKVEGGLAIVSTERLFRNSEDSSIEATITFPVPIDAVLVGLETEIGNRRLTGQAQAKEKARATYEAAIDAGKTAVLHEEALRGVHIISVAHIAAGTEIKVLSRWVQPINFANELPTVRIPTTVGDIYGRSPLIDADDLIHAPHIHYGTIRATSSSGTIQVAGIDAQGRMPLDRPIDITIADWLTSPIAGSLADGRKVSVQVTKASVAETAIDVAILLDVSGSMRERAGEKLVNKEVIARNALRDAFDTLGNQDRVELWEFSDHATKIGQAHGRDTMALLPQVRGAGGGTQLGTAFDAVAKANSETSIVLITDGNSHDFDVLTIAGRRQRINVVLIGENSLEANVGHLAALTGGQLFAASGYDAKRAITAAINATRAANRLPNADEVHSGTFPLQRGGALIEVSTSSGIASSGDDIGAYVAGVMFGFLPEEQASAIAVANNLVTHLTSLVLVDEVGEKQEGLPAHRKVPLSTPRSAKSAFRGLVPSGAMMSLSAQSMASSEKLHFAASQDEAIHHSFDALRPSNLNTMLVGTGYPISPPTPDGRPTINWSNDPEGLKNGDFAGQSAAVKAYLVSLSMSPSVAAFAQELSITRYQLVVALLAALDTSGDRTAQRILRSLAAGRENELKQLAAVIGATVGA